MVRTLTHMSRGLVFDWDGDVVSFELNRIERAQLYGTRRRVAVDESGTVCTRASMTADGSVIIRPGMTAQGWFTDEGEQVESAEIAAVGPSGEPLTLHPSTIGVAQKLEGPVDAKDVLDLAIDSVFGLSTDSIPTSLLAALDAGKVFRFTYCYRPDPVPQVGFLIANAEGVFAVVGQPVPCPWATREQSVQDGEDADDDELDFEMM